jgi:hypothetical protein
MRDGWHELQNGAVKLRGGEPVKVRTPCPPWESLLLKEIAEALGLRITLARDWTIYHEFPRWRARLDGDYRARVETWHRIGPGVDTLAA